MGTSAGEASGADSSTGKEPQARQGSPATPSDPVVQVEVLIAQDRHWVTVKDILTLMEKINKEASKQHGFMEAFPENCMSEQGRRLRAELEDTLELLAVVVLMKR